MTLDVSQRLKAILQSRGYRVIMTRDSDVFIPLGVRSVDREPKPRRDFCLRALQFGAPLRRKRHRDLLLSRRQRGSRRQHSSQRRGHRADRESRDSATRLLRFAAHLDSRRAGRVRLSHESVRRPHDHERGYRQRLAEAIARGIRAPTRGVQPPDQSWLKGIGGGSAAGDFRSGFRARRAATALQSPLAMPALEGIALEKFIEQQTQEEEEEQHRAAFNFTRRMLRSFEPRSLARQRCALPKRQRSRAASRLKR